MKKLLFLMALFIVPLWTFGANTPQKNDVTNSSRLYRTSFYLYAGSEYKFRTYSVSQDTVVHILDSNNSQVAYNDDCGSDCDGAQYSLNSTVTFTPSTSGYYYGILRHYSSGRTGVVATIKAYRDGNLVSTQTDRPVGGYKISVDTWDAYTNGFPLFTRRHLFFHYFNRSKEETGGASVNDTVLYLASSYNTITDFDDDSGPDLSPMIQKTSGSCSSGCRVFGGAYHYSSQSEGNARLIVDVDTMFNDADSDGLSDSLETILGTTSSDDDSDDDGLNDYIEAIGTEDILLPWEGSDPTEKDVFIEVDYFGKMIGTSMFYFYKNFESSLESRLKTSFMQHGDIRIHIDVDDYIGVMDDGEATEFAVCGSAPTPAAPTAFYLEDEKSNYFTSTREGIYQWVVAANRHSSDTETSSGLSCGNTSLGTGTDRIIVSLGNRDLGGTLNQYSGTTVHEMGHAFMLTHNGNGNKYDDGLGFAPNGEIYKSVMNYRYQMDGAPINETGDSVWRYSTDGPTNRPDLTWNFLVGCLNNAAEANLSLKKACIDLRPNATPDCDCTGPEWPILDLTSAGVMGEGVALEEGLLDEEDPRSNPIFGRNGRIIAENVDSMKVNGNKFKKNSTKNDKEKAKKEKDKAAKKIYNDKMKGLFKAKYVEELENRGFKEGKDYTVDNDGMIYIF